IVEHAPTGELFENPRHPYTQGLLRAVPRLVPGRSVERVAVAGDPPSPIRLPSGCRFHPRCPIAQRPPCVEDGPMLTPAPDGTPAAPARHPPRGGLPLRVDRGARGPHARGRDRGAVDR